MRKFWIRGTVVALVSYVSLARTDSVNDQLSVKRQQINAIDSQIVELINQRAEIVDKVGEIKSAAGLPVSVPQREQEVLKHISRIGGSGPFPAARLQSVYSTLITQMREWEEERHPSKK